MAGDAQYDFGPAVWSDDETPGDGLTDGARRLLDTLRPHPGRWLRLLAGVGPLWPLMDTAIDVGRLKARGHVEFHVESTGPTRNNVWVRVPPAGETPDGDKPSADHLLEDAWGVIANASQGRWEDQTPEWQDAATRWRDAWHAHLSIAPGGPPPHRRADQ